MANPVSQFQILSQTPEETAEFYSQLFGWSITANNQLGYREIQTGSEAGIQGGIWPAPPNTPSFAQLFVAVDNVSAYIEKAQKLGAKVIVPATSLPDGDEMAILLDPHGMSFGILRKE